ncbi:hypothetical protein [Streptomyces sp. NPDC026673]|uniref:hypothetical protein n=1 Tax=Streptomyces sp. NPDC026673 TaxID=3155724 RepID=UPI0033F2A80A
MTHSAPPAARICPACDGFASAAITTGTRLNDGSRATLRVACPGCRGTGHVPTPASAVRLAQVAR